MYLLFDTNHTEDLKLPIGDGSILKLIVCEEGYFCEDKFKDLVDAQEWEYTESETFTPIEYKDE